MELGLKPDEVKAKGMKFYYGAGCEKCNNLGFKGRCGVFELITMNDEMTDTGSASDVIAVAFQSFRKSITMSTVNSAPVINSLITS